MIIISRELLELGVYVYYAVLRNIRVTPTQSIVDDMLRREEEVIRNTIGDPSRLTENPIVQAYRKLLWRLGVDPTKVRPSSEALARRVLHGSSIPRINNIVDVGNLVSLKTLIPIGLYDLDSIELPLILKLSDGGEEFAPIGSREVERLRKGLPIVVDSKGLVVHVYPHRDSRFSMIKEDTRNLLAISCGAPGVPRSMVREAINMVARLVREINPLAELTEIGVVPGEE